MYSLVNSSLANIEESELFFLVGTYFSAFPIITGISINLILFSRNFSTAISLDALRIVGALNPILSALKAKSNSPYANIAQKKLANLALPDGTFNPQNAGGYSESDAISMLYGAIDKL